MPARRFSGQVSIINEEAVPGVVRRLDVRLPRKVTEKELQAVALHLKGLARGEFQQTFIVYYVPGMEVGAGGWATTHFNPNLQVRILGTSEAEERELVGSPDSDPESDVIGSWLDDRPFVGTRITFYREDGTTYRERRYRDGSSDRDVLIETRVPRGRKFETDPPSGRDYYLLVDSGALELRDDEGLIAIARPL
jgi:hypothetical protein